jgi:exopolysaccharide production protein ExoQ
VTTAAGLGVLILWLVHLADSATTLVTLLAGAASLWILSHQRFRETNLLLWISGAAGVLFALDAQFSLSATVIESLGRDATLTDRTLLWADILAIPNNSLVGAGFESFWLGERLATMWEKWAFRPNQAHNGYLETYVNGGWLGLAFLSIFIISCYRRAKASLISSPWLGQFRMGFLVMILVYNYAEATFKALHPLFFVMFLISLDVPSQTGLRPSLAGRDRFPQRRSKTPPTSQRLRPIQRVPGMRQQTVNDLSQKSRARNFRHH